MELGPHMVLPPVGSVEQVVPEPVIPTVTVMPPSMLAPSLWGKGDPPASIMGKWPHPLGKTKAGQCPWYQVLGAYMHHTLNASLIYFNVYSICSNFYQNIKNYSKIFFLIFLYFYSRLFEGHFIFLLYVLYEGLYFASASRKHLLAH